ncbi:cytochrome P450 [Cubamyces sp. BRFM 1775]|nr:cytochrome P450 [Cubamyces sp. BRFM 1775]
MILSFTTPEIRAVLLAAAGYFLWKIYKVLVFVYRSPLRILPGPPSPSWVYGNSKEVFAVEQNSLPDKWFAQYGKTYVDHEFFMTPRLWTLDPVALNHILMHDADYQRPEVNIRRFSETIGKGILFVQGEEHRRQRRILNPAFGPMQVRDLTEIFVRKSNELRDYWMHATRAGPATVNVHADLSKTTLDIIGLAGFGYDFHALNLEGKPNELNTAFRQLFANSPARQASVLATLATWFPILELIPSKQRKRVMGAGAVIKRVGMQLVAERKTAILREMSEMHKDGIERKDLKDRDLLTLLIKANMAKDVPESQRLSDEDVLGRDALRSSFLLAGHETTSNATTWALYALSQKPEIQQKLREELLSLDTDTPTMDDLNSLPYLDAVVRETLRLHGPVAMLIREAKKDDVIPLSEPFTDRYGRVHNEIRIAKGNKVALPIIAIQRSKDIWGEDALEFKPERWQQPPETISTIPGVWGHMLTFIGGPRACIGYRFSLVELKAILFSIIRAFEFEMALPKEEICIKTAPVQRPSVRSAPGQGWQLPLLVKPYKGDA